MKEKNENIIAHWLEGSISDVELDERYDEEISKDLSAIRDAANELKVADIDSNILLSKIKNNISPISKKHTIPYLKSWVSAIAAVLIGVLVYTSLFNQNIEVSNDGLLYASHNLPDGSVISLNANTQIEYKEDFINSRVLNLSGEAFFQVEKGKTFVVHTKNGNITVLGTSFNVFSRGSYLSVTCKTGKVKVLGQNEYILSPGDNVVLHEGQISQKNNVEINQIASWQNGESTFISSSINIVILALKSQYGYEIIGKPNDLEQKFTGSFVHNDIDKATRMVFLPMGIHYELDIKNKILRIE